MDTTTTSLGRNAEAKQGVASTRVGAVMMDGLGYAAHAVLGAGRTLWRQFHAMQFERKIRDEFKLNRPDAGWYQIRKALEANSDTEAVDFELLRAAYETLSQKLRPQVFTYGFLRA